MDHTARIRLRVLALFLPVAAVLYIGCEALTPRGTDQVITTRATARRLLAIAGRHPGQLYLAGALGLLGLGAVAVSYPAIAALVRGRGSALATVAALVGGLGAFCGALYNVLVFPTLAAAATAHLSRPAAAQFLVTTFSSGFGHGFEYAYFTGQFVAPLLMGGRPVAQPQCAARGRAARRDRPGGYPRRGRRPSRRGGGDGVQADRQRDREQRPPVRPLGQGLTGMRERISAFGGDLDFGPLRPRGWQVTARLCVDPAAAS